MQMLTTLCELTECDIRACLNTLQFLSTKATYITSDLLSGINIGHKDIGKNLFDVWNDIFQQKKPKHPLLQKAMINGINKPKSTIEDLTGTSVDELFFQSSNPNGWVSKRSTSNSFNRIYSL